MIYSVRWGREIFLCTGTFEKILRYSSTVSICIARNIRKTNNVRKCILESCDMDNHIEKGGQSAIWSWFCMSTLAVNTGNSL